MPFVVQQVFVGVRSRPIAGGPVTSKHASQHRPDHAASTGVKTSGTFFGEKVFIKGTLVAASTTSSTTTIVMKKKGKGSTKPSFSQSSISSDPKWFRVAKAVDFGDTERKILETQRRRAQNGDAILVLKNGGEFFAVDANCSHLRFPMQAGTATPASADSPPCITCPLHKSEFNLRTGEPIKWCTFPPDPFHQSFLPTLGGGEKPIRTYKTRVTGGFVEVQVPEY
mmetsp:Transcript_23418/g.38519  ORF Transcript_23418/g.38519 Transcript_23418/m.38519 type:complete len:225 (-) Transcript_23418:495-1169(-)